MPPATAPTSEAQLVNAAISVIRDRLPAGWVLSDPSRKEGRGEADAVLVLSAPDGRSVSIEVEAKRGSVTGRDALGLAQIMLDRATATNSVPLLAARYLSPQVRTQLQTKGVSYADATGNIMLSAINPGIYVADRGGNRDPWRGAGRPRGNLKGDPAARVVRTLLDYSRSWRVRDLIATSGASTGATYRVLEYLDGEGLVDRTDDRRWVVRDWERLLREWADDYNFLTENTVRRCIDPRGIEHLQHLLVQTDRRYAITGAAAAAEWTSVAPTRSLFVYVESAVWDAEEWGLRAAETGVNVVLVEPRKPDGIVFVNTGELPNGVRRAAPAQVAVDLLNGPGRDPSEAEELLIWMKDNEDAWRMQ